LDGELKELIVTFASNDEQFVFGLESDA